MIVDGEAELGQATEANLKALGGDAMFIAMDRADRSALPLPVEMLCRGHGRFAPARQLLEAIRAISKVAASEWGPQGVRVNLICPFAKSPRVMEWKEWAQD